MTFAVPTNGPRFPRRQFLAAAAATGITAGSVSPQASAEDGRWVTLWQDDFAGTALDLTSWSTMSGPGQTDLRDQQYNDPGMVSIDGQNLVLKARHEPLNGFAYRAGSITTRNKRVLGPHGRLTTRQFLTPGTGAGLGVCLFGQNIDSVGWPSCGEIDATEIALGRPGSPFGSIHGPGYSGGSPIANTYSGPLPTLAGRWVDHVLDWSPWSITWSIDGTVYHSATPSDPRASAGWPFDQAFFVQLVVTVGSWASGDVNLADWPTGNGGIPEFSAIFDSIRFEQWQAW
ncbi:family 16 glycosylhydrolase [Rathayibacter sp. VKM Ac-2857]|uniref:glycoside hydrolase family 16 protein n=1 Tax=Rathayibacter sp. VKM Ac-2857 TaxID=2739020 RepID=UPI0015670578|nr:glycoside hydrolase family 16 protein [Rathayibacter sp. VKM Ac-2857]NQX16606.1 glycoside hydrolase family 16 protein [Rathayibacter sp. VKM Ac-2857]